MSETHLSLSTADRLDILKLIAKYNFAVDALDPEGRADCFTDDGVFRAGNAVRASGRQGLIDYVTQSAARGNRLRHWTCNAIIDSTGENSARLRCYVMAFNLADGIERPYVMGDYDDALVKIGGTWKFKLRQLNLCAGKSLGPV